MTKEELKITTCEDIDQNKDYVYISYASKDSDIVFNDCVVPLQEKYGLNVYCDLDFKNHAAETWTEQMEKNMMNAKACILFTSKDYVCSCANFLEVLTAIVNKVPVLKIQINSPIASINTGEKNISEPTRNHFQKIGAQLEHIDKMDYRYKYYRYYLNIKHYIDEGSIIVKHLIHTFVGCLDDIANTKIYINSGLKAIKNYIDNAIKAHAETNGVTKECNLYGSFPTKPKKEIPVQPIEADDDFGDEFDTWGFSFEEDEGPAKISDQWEDSGYIDKSQFEITTYRDNKAYAYISCAEANKEEVHNQLVLPLQQNYGFRYYSNAISDHESCTLSDRMKNIDKKVRNAGIMVIFTSKEYVCDPICLLEIFSAFVYKKSIVMVELNTPVSSNKDIANDDNVRIIFNEIDRKIDDMDGFDFIGISQMFECLKNCIQNGTLNIEQFSKEFCQMIFEFSSPKVPCTADLDMIKRIIDKKCFNCTVFKESEFGCSFGSFGTF